jgi:hypothetical protein
MEQYYQQFVTTLYKFVSDLHRYIPTEGTEEFLKYYDKLNMGKVLLRYYNMTHNVKDRIKIKDETLFSESYHIFPNIDLHLYWPQLIPGQKKKVWTYINMLQLLSELLLDGKDNSDDTINMVSISSTENNVDANKPVEDGNKLVTVEDGKKVLHFNPYIGVGGNNENYSVDEMFSGPQELPEGHGSISNSQPGLGSLAGLVGIDKMIDIGELKNQLKNMTKDDINDATNNIKELLGTEVDENTTNLISNMLTNITEELNNENLGSGNPLDNIVKIADSVAKKMKPQMESQNVDISKLWNSTQNLANQYKDENGQQVFGKGMNPFDLVNKMMGSMHNNDPILSEHETATPEDYINNCNNMLQEMGINGIDLRNFDPNALGSRKNKRL